MTTHALRIHGRFLGHMTQEEADAIIAKHVDDGAHAKDFDVHRRQDVELLVRGNLVDTFDRVEEAELARDNLRLAAAEQSPLRPDAGAASAQHVAYEMRPGKARVPVREETNPDAARWAKENPRKPLPANMPPTIQILEERDVMIPHAVELAAPSTDDDGMEIIDRAAERAAAINTSKARPAPARR